MTDVYGPEKRSAVMRRVKGRDTTPEKTVRRLLTRLGARYRLHRKDLPGKPDIVMPGRRLALFVHGCFWHGHDEAAREALIASGWRVETLWECELKDEGAVTARLEDLLRRPR